MMKYIRKIGSKGRWDPSKVNLYPGSFSSADILLSDLKTEQNTLSVWCVSDDVNLSEVEDVIVALALTRDNIQKMCYVIMDSSELDRLEIPNEYCIGNADGMLKTSVLEKHRNLIKIDFWRLGYMAEYIFKLVGDDNCCITVSDKDIVKLIKKYTDNNWVDINEMKPNLRENYLTKVEKYQSKS